MVGGMSKGLQVYYAEVSGGKEAPTTMDYIESLKRDKDLLVDLLMEKGVPVERSDTFTQINEK